ncbi:MAG: GNAT family N-acetyltransferase [Verrucomicrobia bacterium]|nr:GNAT family N-acetyltransferase [Verrucomicrobiota bacterium]
MITVADRVHLPVWLELRYQVYPSLQDDFHLTEMELWLRDPSKQCWIAFDHDEPVGFLEASMRNLVDGCLSSPVGYIEGITVLEPWRGRSYARDLIQAAEAWMLENGCSEVATDAELNNPEAITFHKRMGFSETYRIVQFRKELRAEQ